MGIGDRRVHFALTLGVVIVLAVGAVLLAGGDEPRADSASQSNAAAAGPSLSPAAAASDGSQAPAARAALAVEPKGEIVRRNDERELVVLLHGLGRTEASMLILASRLEERGWEVATFGYVAALDGSIDRISEELLAFLGERAAGRRYHLIAHSMGNVVVRAGFRRGYPPGLGRIVMLAPPNQRPHLATEVADWWLFQVWSGESGQQLADEAFYRELPVPPVEFGVIAGDAGPSTAFDEPNDGIVTVASTRLEGMKDFLVVPHLHTFIMNFQDTVDACDRFLRAGSFAAPAEPAAAP